MRVFAKDVTGQKLVHGFESRPLRFISYHTNISIGATAKLLKDRATWPNLFGRFFTLYLPKSITALVKNASNTYAQSISIGYSRHLVRHAHHVC